MSSSTMSLASPIRSLSNPQGSRDVSPLSTPFCRSPVHADPEAFYRDTGVQTQALPPTPPSCNKEGFPALIGLLASSPPHSPLRREATPLPTPPNQSPILKSSAYSHLSYGRPTRLPSPPAEASFATEVSEALRLRSSVGQPPTSLHAPRPLGGLASEDSLVTATIDLALSLSHRAVSMPPQDALIPMAVSQPRAVSDSLAALAYATAAQDDHLSNDDSEESLGEVIVTQHEPYDATSTLASERSALITPVPVVQYKSLATSPCSQHSADASFDTSGTDGTNDSVIFIYGPTSRTYAHSPDMDSGTGDVTPTRREPLGRNPDNMRSRVGMQRNDMDPPDESTEGKASHVSPPRAIPALHGVSSLPYARCPSGAEGVNFEQSDNLARIVWGLEERMKTSTSTEASLASVVGFDSHPASYAHYHPQQANSAAESLARRRAADIGSRRRTRSSSATQTAPYAAQGPRLHVPETHSQSNFRQHTVLDVAAPPFVPHLLAPVWRERHGFTREALPSARPMHNAGGYRHVSDHHVYPTPMQSYQPNLTAQQPNHTRSFSGPPFFTSLPNMNYKSLADEEAGTDSDWIRPEVTSASELENGLIMDRVPELYGQPVRDELPATFGDFRATLQEKIKQEIASSYSAQIQICTTPATPPSQNSSSFASATNPNLLQPAAMIATVREPLPPLQALPEQGAAYLDPQTRPLTTEEWSASFTRFWNEHVASEVSLDGNRKFPAAPRSIPMMRLMSRRLQAMPTLPETVESAPSETHSENASITLGPPDIPRPRSATPIVNLPPKAVRFDDSATTSVPTYAEATAHTQTQTPSAADETAQDADTWQVKGRGRGVRRPFVKRVPGGSFDDRGKHSNKKKKGKGFVGKDVRDEPPHLSGAPSYADRRSSTSPRSVLTPLPVLDW